MKIGKRAQARRMDLGLSQESVASKIGLSRTSITNFEAGRQDISLSRYLALCAALRVTPSDLFV